MKVLYFHQHFSTPKGSAGIRSYEMAKRLLHHGHKVTMVCGSFGPGHTGLTGLFKNGRRDGVVDGIRVIEFELAYSNKLSFTQRTWQFLRFALHSTGVALREDYDLVFATSTPLTAGIPGLFAKMLRRKSFVFEVRDLWPELPKAMGVIRNPIILTAMSALEWLSYHVADRCIGLAPGMVEGIARRGIQGQKIAMVPNGCDVDIFGDAVAPWRPSGVETGDLLAIYTGTHGAANGLSSLVDVAQVLQSRKRSDIKIVLFGDGKDKKALQARVAALGLTNIMFHDTVTKDKVAALMSGADIGIQCLANIPAFYFGTSPNKFFDYIAAGLPVLNNYPGWLTELITQHDLGYSVPPDDPVAFADALEAAANDKANLKRMGYNARKLAENEFSRHRLADQWVSFVTKGALS
jgi:glycosyltransferase involved in cell wall biosynthesis